MERGVGDIWPRNLATMQSVHCEDAKGASNFRVLL